MLMMEQHVAVADRNHIVMEHAVVDGRRILLSEYGIFRIQPMQPCNRLAGFEGLAGRISRRRHAAAGALTVDKKLYPLAAIVGAKAVMVRRPFVA